jgi:pyruvate,water dikinase
MEQGAVQNNNPKYKIEDIGKKGLFLQEMVEAKVLVPPAFVVVSVFDKFMNETRLNSSIKAIYNEYKTSANNPVSVIKMSHEIINIIKNIEFPKDIEESILKEFDKLKTEYVAVRHSSTIVEEMDFFLKKNFASKLNVSKKNLTEAIKQLWVSFFTVPALSYKIEKNIDILSPLSLLMVQKMIMSEISGICYTTNLLTGEDDQILIEASYGLGVNFDSSVVDKDTYIVDKKNLTVLSAVVVVQKKMYTRSDEETVEIEVGEMLQGRQKLSDNQINALAKLVNHLERYYQGKTQEIEWAFFEGRFYILNSINFTNNYK